MKLAWHLPYFGGSTDPVQRSTRKTIGGEILSVKREEEEFDEKVADEGKTERKEQATETVDG
jgi:hypothetical protein